MTALAILEAGPGCTLQDAGRRGWLRHGVTPAGPMDWIAHRAANVLAGNPALAGAIEIGPGGIVLEAREGPLLLGLSARGFAVTRGETALPPCGAFLLGPGERLTVRPGTTHLWAYAAVQGGFDIAPVMGSLATHLRSGIGPLGGTGLHAGQVLPVAAAGIGAEMVLASDPPLADVLRFIPGPQRDAFTGVGVATFCATPYTVSPQSDRMGYRLTGAPLAHARGHDIVSDGIALGAIQVPGDGQPLVLMADRQPTGGYPKIGTVILADLPALAQSRPGRALRFRAVGREEAVAALRLAQIAPAELLAACRPFLPGGLDLGALASGNFASGFTDGGSG